MTKKIEKIDYAAEIAKSKERMELKLVNAIALAPSGGGKSTLAGTFGVPTLYLYTNSETHGPEAAMTFATAELTPICIDSDRTPDEAIDFLITLLKDKEFLASYEAIVIDGATALDHIIRETSRFSIACLTDKGKHSGFAEGPAAVSIFNEILEALRNTRKHTLITCILDVSEIDPETGEIVESKPRLSTYALAETVILQHPEIFIISPLTKDDKTAHRIQFGARMSKSSKDLSGRIKKTINFTPRITGLTELPNSLPARMTEIVQLKQKKGKKCKDA